MEKPWLYFKVEFELVKDWQLYSWKLLMESIAGTSWAGRRETSMLDKQLKGLISGVTHPWSIFKGREIFLWLSISGTGLSHRVFHKGFTSSLAWHHPASGKLSQIHQLVKPPMAKPLQLVCLVLGAKEDGWIKNTTVHYFSKRYCWAVNGLKPNVL